MALAPCSLPLFFFLVLLLLHPFSPADGLGVNWGTRSSHPLPPDIVVRLLKDNGFDKVKLFEAEPWVLKALGRSGVQVMLGIPNEFLTPLASSVSVAEQWVMQNVSTYISKYGVDIRYMHTATFVQIVHIPVVKFSIIMARKNFGFQIYSGWQ